MNALAVIGTTIGCGLAGAGIGMILGLREGGDLNMAPAIYAPVGGLLGAFAGVVVGTVVFG